MIDKIKIGSYYFLNHKSNMKQQNNSSEQRRFEPQDEVQDAFLFTGSRADGKKGGGNYEKINYYSETKPKR